MKRITLAALAVLVSGALLTGCGKQIDVAATGAQRVPGTTHLYRFCDGPTLIYFTNYDGGPDEFEFVIYDGCSTAPDADPRVAGE